MSLAASAPDYVPVWAAALTSICRPGGLAITDHALALCDLPAGARVLDVGCGPAVVCVHLRERHGLNAFGLDFAYSALRPLAPRLPLTQAVGETLPFPAASFDLVLAECSLSLMMNPRRALAEFRRVLRPGGWLVVSDLYALGGAPAELWDEPQLKTLIGEAGFTAATWEDHTPALKVFAAQRLFNHGTLPPLGCAPVAPARLGYFLLSARRS